MYESLFPGVGNVYNVLFLRSIKDLCETIFSTLLVIVCRVLYG